MGMHKMTEDHSIICTGLSGIKRLQKPGPFPDTSNSHIPSSALIPQSQTVLMPHNHLYGSLVPYPGFTARVLQTLWAQIKPRLLPYAFLQSLL